MKTDRGKTEKERASVLGRGVQTGGVCLQDDFTSTALYIHQSLVLSHKVCFSVDLYSVHRESDTEENAWQKV